jgi:hypothetical protein
MACEALGKPLSITGTTKRGLPQDTKNGFLCTGGTRSVASAIVFERASFKKSFKNRSRKFFFIKPG